MSDWTIGLVPPPGGRGYWIADYLTARAAWKRLSKPAQAAVEAAYNGDGHLLGVHPLTLASLVRHGFAFEDEFCRYLTEAAYVVAKSCVGGKP